MLSLFRSSLLTSLLLLLPLASALSAQTTDASQSVSPRPDPIASILDLDTTLAQLRAAQSQRACSAPPSLAELVARQQLVESILAGSLDLDGALAEIANERAGLAELRSRLEARRDRAVGLLNIANLITGTGVGIAVNAMQFRASTANLGDAIGVGSGIASTVLSVLGIRRQNGPQHGIGEVPNMLAPLFDRPAVLNTYYPPEVLLYLSASPSLRPAGSPTRLDLLNREWERVGRLPAPGTPARAAKLNSLTASMTSTVRVSISDLQDRSAMLGDVSGRLSLMKRDMAVLMRSLKTDASCQP